MSCGRRYGNSNRDGGETPTNPRAGSPSAGANSSVNSRSLLTAL